MAGVITPNPTVARMAVLRYSGSADYGSQPTRFTIVVQNEHATQTRDLAYTLEDIGADGTAAPQTVATLSISGLAAEAFATLQTSAFANVSATPTLWQLCGQASANNTLTHSAVIRLTS